MSWSVGWTARSSTPCPSTTLFRSRGQNALRHRFMQVRGWLSEGPLTLLDVGCGEGHSEKYFNECPSPQPTSSSVNGPSDNQPRTCMKRCRNAFCPRDLKSVVEGQGVELRAVHPTDQDIYPLRARR